jgi:hypothetical protein
VRVFIGSNFGYIKAIAFTMLLSNIGSIVYIPFYKLAWNAYNVKNDEALYEFWIILYSLSVFSFQIGFNVAHWIFGYKYYKIGNVMQYFLADEPQPVPEHVIRRDRLQNMIWLGLNIGVALFCLFFFFISNINYYNPNNKPLMKKFALCYTYGKTTLGLLQIVSAVYLGYGIYKIRQLAKKG